ncbi:MAG: hypothetical protein HOK14_05400 [Gammaproteobacteria bacterium]|nr:hypothetical protein [Gammaproteobacteria bacterium]MBT6419757.1 hypothetical protein [Gammaproteobacteria bacterium]MBT7436180.1 hypothetical protein [Gammaproteobacteria bacterium]
MTKQFMEYDSSCIKILKYAPDIWSQAIALDEKYNYGVKLIERGVNGLCCCWC